MKIKNFVLWSAIMLANMMLFGSANAVYEISDGSVKALYHFEGDSVDSAGSNTGSDTSMTYSATAKVGSLSADFDGSASKITVASNNFPTGGADRSVCYWFYRDSAKANNGVFGYGSGAGASRMDQQHLTNTTYDAYGIADDLTYTAAVPTTTWTHYCMTFGSGNGKIYVNGAEVASGALSWNTDAGTTAYYGVGIPSWNSFYYDGKLDEMLVFNTKISTTTISALYAGGTGTEVCTSVGCASPPAPTSSATLGDVLAPLDVIDLIIDGFALIVAIGGVWYIKRYDNHSNQ